ncbi:transcription-repair coupling factor [Thermoproteota archaeon]
MNTSKKPLIIDLKNQIRTHYQDIMGELANLGYQRVNMVMEPGDFAVRGNIIDIFGLNQSHPIRLEYENNVIERLNSFNAHTQRSISTIYSVQINHIDLNQKSSYLSWTAEEADTSLLADLQDGDYVVHEQFGIGIFKGLIRLSYSSREGEFLFIHYKGKDKLYVPLEQLRLVYKYSGGEIKPEINALYDGSWQKIQSKAKKYVQELAEDLYLLYKLRKTKQGFAFQEDSVWQIDLEQSFEYEETPDQKQAVHDVKRDMESAKPMDRLLCGDVGYGKTEVMLRAAFKAIENKKQTAILVPTTILAEQHFKVFSKRLKLYPYTVEILSRFKKPKEQAQIISKLKSHGIDIIIGTHRLLQKDIEFADLGLLIIDEEQRFGVTHKEKIKHIKPHLDVLTVTATPIPRTLYMALTGARDLSRLETPPHKRKPILTKVTQYSDDVVKEAVYQEINRKGQIFFLHNQVETIERKYKQLSELLPDITIMVAHGQMKEAELKRVMEEFYEQKAQMLLCTTIIESGLDVKNVNTIILEKAERFGLSQIHQLRGRVGRTQKQGYAYLLYTDESSLTDKAKKRLKSIHEYAALGAGYKLALKDLEIRGAGTLLGHKQHGLMTAIGFDLYCKLLSKAVNEMKHAKIPEQKSFILPEGLKFYIPNTYIESERERLAIYRRIMNLNWRYQMDDLNDELKDRYGPLPKFVTVMLDAIQDLLD